MITPNVAKNVVIYPDEPCLIEGIHQASRAIALNMLGKGIDITTIAEVTDLTESVVETFLTSKEKVTFNRV
ncbi:hypothetical protein CRENPOLYSF2_2040006 [Crenothrix polyspora]|uniref:Transcriptional regulator n=1 Tax=Crenothrix polyspora TaxID=360316 RepID=A0A1R4H4L4_9GAMM|nr:hypothetical protein [Crenothrix polyspora]SJM91126.1 hypothetical protein CRENPOLYSF2_2040006 [Crenothrix polyspora]